MVSLRTTISIIPPPKGSYFTYEYLAFDHNGKFVASDINYDDAKGKSIARGCFTPLVIPASYLIGAKKRVRNESGELERKLE